MGQKYVPELHDPKYRGPEGQDNAILTDKEVKRTFDAIIAEMDNEVHAEPGRE